MTSAEVAHGVIQESQLRAPQNQGPAAAMNDLRGSEARADDLGVPTEPEKHTSRSCVSTRVPRYPLSDQSLAECDQPSDGFLGPN